MHLEDRGLVFDAEQQPVAKRVAAFVSLCLLRSGGLLCGFQLGPRKNDAASTIRFCRSTDHGTTWRETGTGFETTFDGIPGSLSSGELVQVESGELLLLATWFDRSDPDRPLFDPETQGILHSKLLLATSIDEGASWSRWTVLQTAGLSGCSGTGPILKWPDGTIALPFESYKEFDDPNPARHAAWVLVSRDSGVTFTDPIQVAQDPQQAVYYWDQRLCCGRSPDELIALFWTHNLIQKRDMNVHFRYASLTENGIQTSPMVDTAIPGQISAPLLLQDERLLAFVVNRTPPANLTLWQSTDGGSIWHQSESLVVYTHDEQAQLSQGTTGVDFDQYWEDMAKWSFGHPAIRKLDERRVLLTYYAGVPDRMSVHWARVNIVG